MIDAEGKTLAGMDDSFSAEVHPWEDFDSVMNHAVQARRGGDAGRAHAFYSRAVELKPEDTQGWIGWASTAQELDEAILGWGHALALVPQDLRVRDALHDAIVNKIETDGREQSESFLALGRRLAQMGLRHFAHQLLVRATELSPMLEDAWLWRGGTSDDSSETTTCLRNVLEINPENVQARAGLRWSAPKTSDTSPPTEPIENIAQIMAEGRRAFGATDRKRAYELFLRATELAPNDAQAWFWRGTLAVDHEEAVYCMDQVLRIDPENMAAQESRWVSRIRSLRAKGSPKTNRQMIAEIIAPDPEEEFADVEEDDEESQTRRIPIVPLVLIGAVVAIVAISLLFFFWS